MNSSMRERTDASKERGVLTRIQGKGAVQEGKLVKPTGGGGSAGISGKETDKKKKKKKKKTQKEKGIHQEEESLMGKKQNSTRSEVRHDFGRQKDTDSINIRD